MQISIFTLFTGLLGGLCSGQVTAAVDTDPCNCSPRQITFKVDFSGECWNPGLPEGAGAIEDLCTISSPNFEVTPLQLTKIHIEEYDESGTKVKEFEDFYAADGDTFSYTSFYEENPNSILGGMAVTLVGFNSMNEEVTNAFTLSYTNECGVPTFQVGDSIGWLVVDSLTPSWHDGCGYPTSSPSASPTSNPTISPSTSPTPSPTASPICNCFPKEISFKLNFSGTCEDTNVGSAAVREKACLVAGFEFPVVDNEPVEMNSIAVYELDADSKNILQQKTMNRSFQNGDIFSYTAYTDESAMTGAIQLRILARNRLGETIVNQLAITFSNKCGIPAIEVGDYLGWVTLDSLVPPSGGECGYSSLSPSISPISVPSSSPTASPTASPMCNCFPKEISFKFNFSLSCEDTNIVEIAGSQSSCLVHGMEGMVNDYVPIAIEGIEVLQLGIDLNVIHQTTMQGGFGNGEGFLYTAYTDEENTLTGGLQLNIFGVNNDNDKIINVFAIIFSNECGVQLFEVGDNIGWVIFDSLTPSSECVYTSSPSFSPTSRSPTSSPSAPPSATPTTSTSSPSTTEIDDPSEPTLAPTTSAPTPRPTFAKTAKNAKNAKRVRTKTVKLSLL